MPQPGTSGMEPSFGDPYGNHRCFLILEPYTISPLGSSTEYEEKGMVLMLGSPAITCKRPFELLSDLVDDGFGEDLHHERWDVSALDDIAHSSKGSLEGELVISEGTLTAKRSRSMEGLTEQAGSLSGQQAQGNSKTEIMTGSDSEAQLQENSPEAEVTEMKPPPLEQHCGEHNYSLQAEPNLGSGTESGDAEEEAQGAAVETTADVNSGPECGPDDQVIRQPKKRRCFWEYSQGHIAESKRECCRQSLCWSSTTLPSTLYLREGMAWKGKKYPRKARKTDASDLTPNPQKLCTIGDQLHKLNAAIEGMTPANDLPIVARARSRKEKNKLASRACRLKKKAQHEANKIKLWGLNQEYENLLRALLRIKEVIRRRVESRKSDNEMGMTDTLESILKESAGPRVAGQTKEFVERILESSAV
ncbi:CREB3 regulatory factor-like isoform X1 [Scleropages formosus]|uniref:CREB3 regulatory factor-like n=1 Tax=Scleropages formosus TaxID=113540 RepID=A0A8C9RVX9_SCLFO|nr:CREB3 regulatory factor-like isoform X1 [Scleropages formosus]